MLETKSLTSSTKSELYDDLLSSIDQEYCGKSIALPAELVSYVQGLKIKSEEEGSEMRQLYDAWTARILRALGRAKKDATQQREILQEILNSLPEPYKTEVIEALITIHKRGQWPPSAFLKFKESTIKSSRDI